VGCVGPNTSVKEVNAFESQHRAVVLANPVGPTPAVARASIRKFEALFSNDPDAVAARARVLFAEDAWVADTLAVIQGRDQIAEYMKKSAMNVKTVAVKVEDVAVSGADYYVRWRMDIQFKQLRNGEPTSSIGVSLLRFNRKGEIVMQQDFWDSTSAFYKHVPFVGGQISFIQGLIH